MTSPTRRFKEIWFRELDQKDKDQLTNALRNSLMADRLREILDEWERELTVSRSDYDTPGWPYKQAHFNGELAVLTKLKKILTEDAR